MPTPHSTDDPADRRPGADAAAPLPGGAGPDPVRWLRVVGRAEAVSFLVLLGVAMPLKYAAGWPEAVSVVGLLHGVLFLVFVGLWLGCLRRLPRGLALRALVASVIPAGPFWIDRRLQGFESGAAGR